ncbi:7TM receptor family protein [gamma proteobacterium HdN1]|nr:7TM receptor family protein [gamma proteobacterium HdN1]
MYPSDRMPPMRSFYRTILCRTKEWLWAWCALFFSISMLLAGNAFAASSFQQDRSQEPTSVNLATYLHIYEDTQQRLSLSDVMALPESRWAPNRDQVFNAGFTLSSWWFYVDLSAAANGNHFDFLEIENPLLDNLDVYFVTNGLIETQITLGDSLPFSRRMVDHRNFLIPLPKISLDRNTRVYIRVTTSGTMQLPIYLWKSEAFLEADQMAVMWQSLFYGIMLAMAFVNFFVYLATFNISYFYYVGTVVSLLLFQATLHGYGYRLLWPDNQWWQEHSIAFFVSCICMFAMLFTISFLHLREQKKTYYFLFKTLAILSVIGVLLSLVLPYALALRFAVVAIALGSPLCVLIGIVLLRSGYKPARFYLLSWNIFLISSMVLLANKVGLLEVSWLTENIQQAGATLQAFILALALADEIQQMHKDQLSARETQLQHERDLREARERTNRELEQRVEERTQALEDAVQKLASTNEQLERMSIIDELSQLHNRRYFNHKFETDFKTAYREQCSISVIMFDVDHFKKINDHYGHLVGDYCIAHVAGILKKHVTRASDIVARYGGEEFVVVLNNTNAQGALHVAEEIRREVFTIPMQHDGMQIPMTVSGGVAAGIPHHYQGMAELLNLADNALYKAKQNGRNQIAIAPPQDLGSAAKFAEDQAH